VCGLTTVVVGLIATALVLRHSTGDAAQWAIVGPLLLAGLGGGMVTSPNMTLTLQHVPVGMAGAAGGAAQTAQRIGAAIGTAALATIFYHVLPRTGHDYPGSGLRHPASRLRRHAAGAADGPRSADATTAAPPQAARTPGMTRTAPADVN
jgi:hypothetical protein